MGLRTFLEPKKNTGGAKNAHRARTCNALMSCRSSWLVRNKGVMPASESFSTASLSCGDALVGLLLKKTATFLIRNPFLTRLNVFLATKDMAVSRLCCLDVRAT